MFVRFQHRGRRLRLAVVENRRENGAVRTHIVASLPSVPDQPTTTDRAAFWHKLHERFAGLGNRVDAATAAKLMSAIHNRIPMPAPGDRRAAQIANLRKDIETSDRLGEMISEMIEGRRAMVAALTAEIAELEPHHRTLKDGAAADHEHITRLECGEDIAAGLNGRRFGPAETSAIVRAIGVTAAGMQHMQNVAAMPEQMHEEYIAKISRHSRRREYALARKLLAQADGPPPEAEMMDGEK
jgi:hypothetical protein